MVPDATEMLFNLAIRAMFMLGYAIATLVCTCLTMVTPDICIIPPTAALWIKYV